MFSINTSCRTGLVLAALISSTSVFVQQQEALATQQPSGLSSSDIQIIIDHERQGMIQECLLLRQSMGLGMNINSETRQMLARCDWLEQQARR